MVSIDFSLKFFDMVSLCPLWWVNPLQSFCFSFQNPVANPLRVGQQDSTAKRPNDDQLSIPGTAGLMPYRSSCRTCPARGSEKRCHQCKRCVQTLQMVLQMV